MLTFQSELSMFASFASVWCNKLLVQCSMHMPPWVFGQMGHNRGDTFLTYITMCTLSLGSQIERHDAIMIYFLYSFFSEEHLPSPLHSNQGACSRYKHPRAHTSYIGAYSTCSRCFMRMHACRMYIGAVKHTTTTPHSRSYCIRAA